MPEGPEVKRLVDKLKKNLRNKKIKKIKLISGRYSRNIPKNYEIFLKKLPLVIHNIECKGKFIYFTFKKSDITLWNTLGMTGFWTNYEIPHNNVKLIFEEESIFFNDVRNFGTIIFNTRKELEIKLSNLGPDILDDYNNTHEFIKKIRNKKKDTTISNALLDQKVAAGCGNYLRAEVLYQQKMNPFLKLREIDDNDLKKLWINLKKIAKQFYLKPYTKIFKVYNQIEDPKGNPVYKTKINNRTIHYSIIQIQ
jgi:DNA-formamidopyrimidine glycosylase